MHRTKTNLRVVGVDVGGRRKGFHAVAMDGTGFLARRQTSCVEQLAGWCREEIGARLVAVDAPCRWSAGDGARPAERELLAQGIRCFLTPTRRAAVAHPKDYYEWMLRGADLFRRLEPTHTPSAAALQARTPRVVSRPFPTPSPGTCGEAMPRRRKSGHNAWPCSVGTEASMPAWSTWTGSMPPSAPSSRPWPPPPARSSSMAKNARVTSLFPPRRNRPAWPKLPSA